MVVMLLLLFCLAAATTLLLLGVVTWTFLRTGDPESLESDWIKDYKKKRFEPMFHSDFA